MILDYKDFLFETGSPKAENFETFASNRMSGAAKIADSAKEKGGDAMLTYHHFKVKLPYYKKAISGSFDFEKAEEELEEKLQELTKGLSGSLKLSQIDFQKLMGEIEVIGELLIKHK